jgi:hypothetical protein
VQAFVLTMTLVSTSHFVAFLVQVAITKITKGNELEHHTLIWEHNRRSLSKASDSNMDFDRIIALFGLGKF